MIHYWSDEDHRLAKQAKRMEELAHVALCILERMPKPIVQVCGPITTGGLGCVNLNIARFKFAVKRLDELEIHTLDQMEFHEHILRIISSAPQNGSYNWEILEVFYRQVFRSGHIERCLFLPDWQSSTGACWEHKEITSLRIPWDNYPSAWLRGFTVPDCECDTCHSPLSNGFV